MRSFQSLLLACVIAHSMVGVANTKKLEDVLPSSQDFEMPFPSTKDLHSGIPVEFEEEELEFFDDEEVEIEEETDTIDGRFNPQLQAELKKGEAFLRSLSQSVYITAGKNPAITKDTVNLAKSYGATGFIAIDEKKLSLTRFDSRQGKTHINEFARSFSCLQLVNDKAYTHSLGSYTRSERECVSSIRNTYLRKLAHTVGAVSSHEEVSYLTPGKLYLERIPVWLNAAHVDDIMDYVTILEKEFSTSGVDVSFVPQEYKPLLIITIKDDTSLSTLDSLTWEKLAAYYNVTSFAHSEAGPFFEKEKALFEDKYAKVKESKVDITPSRALRGWRDIKNYHDNFNFTKMRKEFLGEVSKAFPVKLTIPVIVGYIIWKNILNRVIPHYPAVKGIKEGWDWLTGDSAKKDVKTA